MVGLFRHVSQCSVTAPAPAPAPAPATAPASALLIVVTPASGRSNEESASAWRRNASYRLAAAGGMSGTNDEAHSFTS